jgi:hypothetical protein
MAYYAEMAVLGPPNRQTLRITLLCSIVNSEAFFCLIACQILAQ